MSKLFSERRLILLGNMLECTTGAESDLKTAVICTRDKENLYFNFICESDGFSPKHKEFNAPLYEGDIAEILLSLDKREHYLEIEVNQNNAQYCVLIDNDGSGNFEITKLEKPCFSSEVFLRENEWECEISLPLVEIEKLGGKLDGCYINLLRQDYDKAGNLRLYSLYPTYCNSFHKCGYFEKIII